MAWAAKLPAGGPKNEPHPERWESGPASRASQTWEARPAVVIPDCS